jgi:dTDP-4-amino-4,6-dideoxygalactose transaminase
VIRFLNLERLHDSIRPELDAAIAGVIDASRFVGAEACTEFENALAAAHGRVGAAACGSGTDAIALVLRSLGVGHGDEVIVPAMTFVATAEAVVHCGATPVIVDVDPDDLLLAESAVAERRTGRTKAVVPVHLYGNVVPFDRLIRWRQSGLIVVEDAAQAHLADWQGQAIGEESLAACLSFYPGKNLGAAGDGGAVLSDDVDLLARLVGLRDHGSDGKYVHTEVGYCSRLDGIQAAILLCKLRHLRRWTDRRRDIATRYQANLVPAGVDVVPWARGAVHHLLVVRVAPDRRDSIRTSLLERGVETGIHYPLALSDQPALRQWQHSCPVAEAAAASVLSLPVDPLMTDDNVDTVSDALIAVTEAE